MDQRLLLVKSITLLYYESLLKDKTENSSDLIRTVLESIQLPDAGLGDSIVSDKIIIRDLKETALNMCNAPIDQEYILTDLLQQIKVNTRYDEKLYEAIKDGINENVNVAQIKRNILNLKRAINNHFKEEKISDILNRASYEFKFKRTGINNINDFLNNIITQLEPLQLNTSLKDPAVMDDIDLGNDTSLRNIFSEIKNVNNGGKIYKTGWTALNRMLQGGIRQGECMVINALQHKYKTGFGLSLFKQIPIYNIPLTKDINKKPLIVRISFEDKLLDNLQFLYQSLKYDETRQFVSLVDVDPKYMAEYVKSKLQVNGFHIKMMRVDPTQWTYKSICNKIIEWEAEGYNVEVLFLDYLALIPTTGCTISGPMGTDMRDLFRRMRNFCSSKNITLITPHQLSTEAKNLLRSGIPEEKFVTEISEKGYYSGSKQLDQELDLEVYIHHFKHNKETYFTVQRGKHRLPTILPEEDKYYIMKFPRWMPIPDDLPGEDQSFKKITSSISNANDDLFKLG